MSGYYYHRKDSNVIWKAMMGYDIYMVNGKFKKHLHIYIYIYILFLFFIWWSPFIPSSNFGEVFTYNHIYMALMSVRSHGLNALSC